MLTKFKKDFRGYFNWKITRNVQERFGEFLSTSLMRIKMAVWDIKYHGRIRFHGQTIFVRHPESTIEIGENCVLASDAKMNLAGINRKCTISTHGKNAQIKIGDNTMLSGTVIGALESIIIGNKVLVGANVFISDFDWHNIDPENRTERCSTSAPIVIEDNVWLGINTSVLKGVKIGRNSVIGANSVVVKNIPDNVIAAGNPCKVIKPIKNSIEETN